MNRIGDEVQTADGLVWVGLLDTCTHCLADVERGDGIRADGTPVYCWSIPGGGPLVCAGTTTRHEPIGCVFPSN